MWNFIGFVLATHDYNIKQRRVRYISHQLKNIIKVRFRNLGVFTVSRMPYFSSSVFLASFFLTS